MAELLPTLLLSLGGVVLLAAIYSVFRSLRAVFDADAAVGASNTATSGRVGLVMRKEALLEDLQDLAFERDSGKLAPEDFERLDAKVRAEAKDVLRALDEELSPYRAEAEALLFGVPSAESST